MAGVKSTASDAATASLIAARGVRPDWCEVPVAHRPTSISGGYLLQGAVHRYLTEAGIRRLGYKIGSTSKPGQTAFGLDEPIYGGIFEDTRAGTLREAVSRRHNDPALECEVAFLLSHDLDGRQGPIDVRTILAAIESCHLACEIIDHRYRDALALGVPTLLADDFFHAGFVLGPANSRWHELDLSDLSATIEIDGAIIIGHSQDVLDPISALRWLVEALARHGELLRAGNIVLTGSIVTPTRVRLPVRTVSLSISGFEPLQLS
jgi:2-keto-4-pentenoate hydratase